MEVVLNSDIKLNKKRKKISWGWVVTYTIMIGLVCFTALPLVYLVCTAFKPLDELFMYPPQFFVRKPTFQNFIELVTTLDSNVVPFTRYVFNSLLTTGLAVFGTVMVSGMGAYALVKLNLPYANKIFAIIIGALMFSSQVTQIANYLVINFFGLVNTYWALIIPKLAVAYNFFLMKQFIEQLPDELLESARIDGAGEMFIFWKIVMPLAKPAWATLVVFAFVANWNDYFSALVYITNNAMKTLPLALQALQGGAGQVARSGAVAAATFLTTLPTILIYVFMQSKVMKTMAYSGIKA